MALTLLAANNAQTVLAAGISASATSLTVNSGTGSLFPAPSDGVSFFKLTLIDAATGQLTEIMHVTARTGDTMTIKRGQEGTTARAWSANDIAVNMMTAGTLSYLLTNFQPLDPTLTAIAALVGAANKLPYFNGPDSAALTDLTAVGRDIIGKNTIADILTYLGLGEDSALPVGVPVPWPSATPPTGWLKCNGAPFSAEEYPKLALAYPSLLLPDLRGEFIRGWDDGRGVDAGRTVGSTQSSGVPNITGYVLGSVEEAGSSASGAFTLKKQLTSGASSGSNSWGFDFDASRSSTVYQDGLTEARPRNVAFNYIVRAA